MTHHHSRTILSVSIIVFICFCTTNGEEPRAYDWRYPKQVHKFSNLNIAFGDISMEIGQGALVHMEAMPGFIGAAIVAPGRLVYKSETGQGIEDSFETAMLRFHYEDYEHIFKAEEMMSDKDPSILRKAMESIFKYHYRCYNSGRLALIPTKGTLAVVFDGKVYGEKILVHYNPVESFINPSLPELMVQKELKNLPEKDTLTRQQQWQYDLLYLSKLLPLRHPNLFFQLSKQEYTRQIDTISKNLSNMSDLEIFLSLRKLFTLIGDAHTTINPLDAMLSMYPLELYWFKDGLFVTSTGGGYEQALKARLVQIGNTDIDTIYQVVSTIIPHENEWQVKKESTYPIKMPGILEGLGLIKKFEAHRLTFETAQGRHFVLNIEDIPWNRLRQIKWVSALDLTDPALPLSLQNPKESYWYRYLEPSKTLYFQNKRCKEMKDKPITDFTKELLAFVNYHEVNKFIFDIRDNSGGDSKFIEPLIEGLSKSKINRRGKLFCLIGRKTFSSAILNAAKIKRDTQAIFVGEPTSGKPCHYGQVESMKLPYSKMRVQYSTKYCGHGDMDLATLIPDIVVQLSSEDFFAGKDPVLETVLAYQEGRKRTIQASK